jgi:hypothetical protein
MGQCLGVICTVLGGLAAKFLVSFTALSSAAGVEHENRKIGFSVLDCEYRG